jgi:S-(hydroxymethyl)glutathione dehydrogenase/alcohol dehydrogenase
MPTYPVVLGHEAAGVISACGDGVTDLCAGDPVILNWATPCRSCWFCREGEPWLCSRVEGAVSREQGHLDGQPLHRALGVGAFCDEVVIPRSSVVPIPSGISLDVAALMGCAALTGTGAVWRTAGVRKGTSVAVVGLGGVGLAVVAGARIAGAAQVIAVDARAGKEALARQLGATDFLLAHPKVGREVRGLTGGRGADHSFECVGSASTIRSAWESTRRGGQCIVVGIGPRDSVVALSAMEIYHHNRSLTSSVFGSSDPERDIPELADHVRSGALDLTPLITHRIDLADVPAAFERMQAGIGARTLIQFGQP